MKGGWEVNLPFLIFKVNMPETKENVVQFAKRKAKEIINWIKDPKTVKAIANAGNILGSGEYPRNGAQSEERYDAAINEQDPEVKARQNGILTGVVTIPTVAIPGSQYVYGGLGTIGTAASVYNYIDAVKEKDEQKQNDAILNGALAFSTVLPMAKSLVTSSNIKLAPWVKPRTKSMFDGMSEEAKTKLIAEINEELKNLNFPISTNKRTVTGAIKQGYKDAITDATSETKLQTNQKNNALIDRLYNYTVNKNGKMEWNKKGIEDLKKLLLKNRAENPQHYDSVVPFLDVENHPDRIWRLLTDTYKLGGKLKYGTNN